MRKLFLTLMMLFATSLFAAQSTEVAVPSINWAKDFADGLKLAKEQNKPVLFVFSRHSCKYCVILEETTFKDTHVIAALNRDYVSIVSYTDEQDYTPRELWRSGTPTLWFLLPNGEPMFQPLVGAVDASNFLKALAIVKDEFAKMPKTGK
jgi:thioredoxin-related protein